MTVVGIDGSSLISGGARTHIQEILRQVDPREAGIDRVILWGQKQLLKTLEPRPWLSLQQSRWLEKGLLPRTFWKSWILPWEAWRRGCRLIYIPAGDGSQRFLPYVAMSRNILPFMPKELDRYGRFSKEWLKLSLLRYTQLRSFRNARGTIYLTEQARKTIAGWGGKLSPSTVIPHGVSRQFCLAARSHREFSQFSREAPARILNIGPIEPAKHQWLLVAAVQKLRQRGIPVCLDLVGPTIHPLMQQRLQQAIASADPGAVTCHGPVPHSDLPSYLKDCDLFCFTSSCENFPNTLVEGMASGAPVVAWRGSPMQEILADGGDYFSDLESDSMSLALENMLRDQSRRATASQRAQQLASQYHWATCARATFEYLALCAKDPKGARS